MQLLLDTQAVYVWHQDPDTLPARVDAAIADARNHVTISAVSFWEISVKQAKGKLAWPDNGFDRLLESDFIKLALTPEHGIAAGRLPPHHSDPFDRMLIAQAQAEDMTLVGADAAFKRYDVAVLWAD